MLVLVMALLGCTGGARPQCERDASLADEATVVEVGVVELCPGDEVRLRPPDLEYARVLLSARHDVDLAVDRYGGRTKVLDASEEELEVSLGGPCLDDGVWRPAEDAYDELVLSVAADGRGTYVDILDVTSLTCMSFGQGSPEAPSGADAP